MNFDPAIGWNVVTTFGVGDAVEYFFDLVRVFDLDGDGMRRLQSVRVQNVEEVETLQSAVLIFGRHLPLEIEVKTFSKLGRAINQQTGNYRVENDALDVGSEALVEPKVVPPLHRD